MVFALRTTDHPASMGPRSRERGGPFDRWLRDRHGWASMGPRSRERGGTTRTPPALSRWPLQWGRAHVSAEGRQHHVRIKGV